MVLTSFLPSLLLTLLFKGHLEGLGLDASIACLEQGYIHNYLHLVFTAY